MKASIKSSGDVTGAFVGRAYKDPRWILGSLLFCASVTYVGTITTTTSEINELNKVRDDMHTLAEELVVVVQLGSEAVELMTESENLLQAYTANMRSHAEERLKKEKENVALAKLSESGEWARQLSRRLDMQVRKINATRLTHPASTGSTMLLTEMSKSLSESKHWVDDIAEQGELWVRLEQGDKYAEPMVYIEKMKALMDNFSKMASAFLGMLENHDAKLMALHNSVRDLNAMNRQVLRAGEDYERRIFILQVRYWLFFVALLYLLIFCIACARSIHAGHGSKRVDRRDVKRVAKPNARISVTLEQRDEEYKRLLHSEIERVRQQRAEDPRI
jgi:hypothetical protein